MTSALLIGRNRESATMTSAISAVDKKRKSWISVDDVSSDVITTSNSADGFTLRASRYNSQEKPAGSYSTSRPRGLTTDPVQSNQPVQLNRTHPPNPTRMQEPSQALTHDVNFQPLVLPAPATMAGAAPAGPTPGQAGSNETNHGPNHGLTRENWSLQVYAPAMLHVVATTFWFPRPFSLLRTPQPEPFRLDHRQVQLVLTSPTLAQTVGYHGELIEGSGRISHAVRCITSTSMAFPGSPDHLATFLP
ncbi:hypothetical protein F511_43683 [Dorcoceras hygrometricum]|uniref:Uncharacterized protein n=1 Tax=Dorcoceras hygrometricum TaxID=472368 RepID=A0A2Z7CEC9_9LAMI|nr:hypothetical protein F511_43683 [Dorcoceras hygrometricum]